MALPDQIIEFAKHLEAADFETSVSIDEPDSPRGEFFLDVEIEDFATEVSFRPGVGFGFYASETEFGQKPDEVFRSPLRAFNRLMQLKQHYDLGSGFAPLGLSDLRALLELTQVELAKRLGITQPSVQKAEQQTNPQLESIAGYITAMGGRLETRVVFDDLEARLDFPHRHAEQQG